MIQRTETNNILVTEMRSSEKYKTESNSESVHNGTATNTLVNTKRKQ
jgi:hypothetical protein